MRSRLLLGALVAAAAALLCALCAPVVVNGDGLGYLKAAPTGIVVPGHLGYLPLLRAVARLLGRPDSLSLLGPARWISILSAAAAAGSLALCAHRLSGARAGLVAGLGCAVSFGTLQAGSDVETYAPALAALCLTTYCALRRQGGGGPLWVALTAAGVAAAALLHVENVLFAPAAALLCAQTIDHSNHPNRDISSPDIASARPHFRPRDVAAVLFGSGALVLCAYLAAFRARGDTASSAIHWVIGASHGFSYPLRWSTPLVALYGMGKTLVYAAYPGQASWPRVIAQSALGVAALGTLLWLARRRRPSDRPILGRLPTIAWIVPYATVGFAFFASDNERWIFLLPPAWLAAAAGAATSRAAARVAAALIALLLAADLALGLPLARDRSLADRADATADVLRDGDLVISPGHSWDEYLGFYRPRALDRFPMIYFTGLLGGGPPMRDELLHRVRDARARKSRVYFARGDEPAEADGWKELVRFDITPQNIDTWLPPGPRVPVAPGLVRIDPPPPVTPR